MYEQYSHDPELSDKDGALTLGLGGANSHDHRRTTTEPKPWRLSS